MRLIVNGEIKKYQERLTVQELLHQLRLSPERVVVELNREILSSDRYKNTTLKADDTLELVQFVGGG